MVHAYAYEQAQELKSHECNSITVLPSLSRLSLQSLSPVWQAAEALCMSLIVHEDNEGWNVH